ncbi:MAG: hypothetical protein P1V97_16965 [Planctomycetota bacterium]|nr:hypothetical protein [Planctomycetota bacterium]
MTEQLAGEDLQEAIPKRSSRKLALGCLLLPIFLVVSYHIVTDFLIKQRVDALKEEIAEVKAASKLRPVLFGEAIPGNAVHDYQAIEWMMDSREAWKAAPPSHLPKTDYGQNYFQNPGLDPGMYSSILYSYAVKDSSIPYSKIELKEAKAFYEKYGSSLIRHIRNGLRKDSCDWTLGSGLETIHRDPSFHVYRSVADLIIYEATLSKNPTQELNGILELLAFASDIEKDFCGEVRIGSEIRVLAYSALNRILQQTLSQSNTERLISTLGKIGRFNQRIAILGRSRWIDCAFAAYAGYPLDPCLIEDEMILANLEVPITFEIKAVLLSEWTYFDDFISQHIELLELPLNLRRKRASELYSRAQGSWATLTKVMGPDWINHKQEIKDRIQFDFIQIAAAARLFQLKNDRWPKQVSELTIYLKRGVPKDPLTNLKDDYQLTLNGADLVLSTTKSPYPDLKGASFKLLGITKSK